MTWRSTKFGLQDVLTNRLILLPMHHALYGHETRNRSNLHVMYTVEQNVAG